MNCNYILFLDDERYLEDVAWVDYPDVSGFGIVRTYYSFCRAIENNFHDYIAISFDHDIQDYDSFGKEFTGQDCLRFLIEYCIENEYNLPEIILHTKNPIGKDNMQSLINSFNNHFKK